MQAVDMEEIQENMPEEWQGKKSLSHREKKPIKLHKLVLRNFKSFKKADIPFSEGFTAIVGANGSGKSNILDALMFSMGATSMKSLRVSKISELIHHDAEDSSARVELVLKCGNEEYRITRKIDKSGKSVYGLNDKRSTLNEIESFLASFSIRPDGHNIVAQGDITRIIDMNPKQRREIIDEIAGIREYEEKKEEAMKKLEKVEKKINDVRIVINERRKYLEQLEKERKAAIRYQELQQETKVTKATIIAEEIKAIKEEVLSKEKRIAAIEKELESMRQEKAKMIENEAALEKRNEELTQQIIEAGERTYSSLGKSVEEKRAAVKISEEKLRIMNENINKAKKELESLSAKKKEINMLINEKKERLRENMARANEILVMLKPLEMKKSEKKSALDSLSSALREKEAKLAEIEKAIEEERKAFFESNSAMLKEKEAELSAMEKSMDDCRNQLNAVQEIIIGEKKEAELLGAEIAKINEGTIKKASEKGRKSIEEFISKIEDFSSLIGNLEGKLDTGLQKKIGLIKEAASKIVEDYKLIKDAMEEISGEKKAKEYAKRLDSIKQKLEHLEKDAQSLKDKMKTLEKSKASKKAEISAVKAAVGNFIAGKDDNAKNKMLLSEKISIKNTIHELKASINSLLSSEVNIQYEKLVEEKNLLNEENASIKAWLDNSASRLKDLEARESSLMASLSDYEKNIDVEKKNYAISMEELKKSESELGKSYAASRLLEEERKRILEKIKKAGEKIDGIALEIEQKERQINEINLEFSKNEVRLSDLQQEFEEFKDVKVIENASLASLKKRLGEIEKEISSLGAINMKSLEDFDAIRKEMADVEEKANKLEEEKNAVLDLIAKIENRKLNVFVQCFSKVAEKFSEIYFDFFEGEGFLELSDMQRPFEGGLLINARYKGDKLKSIDAMSGGEKSLTALAFIFAIQSFEPAPFYILDEADAALDMANSAKFARMILNQAKDSQFIVITHNDQITKEADHIIGVGMNKQKSSVIGLRLKDHINKMKEESTPESS